jgi:G:T-mismatch repair DNA endonuclease (very short patch repair protein)
MDEFSAFGYYSPVSMRLVQAASKARLFSTANQLLPGPGKQVMKDTHGSEEEVESELTVVVFVGGCSWGEVSALRALGTQTNKRYLIVSTGMVTGSQLVQSFSTNFKP